MSDLRKPAKNGQAMVEFALIFLIFTLFLLTIFDLGRAVFYYSAIYNAAREGARYGITDQNVARIKDASHQLVAGIDFDPLVGITEDEVTVRIVYSFETVSPILRIILGRDQIQLQTQATMAIEH